MQETRGIGGLLAPVALMFIGAYFAIAAVQGEYGLFRRIQIDAEAERLRADLATLQDQTAHLRLLTRRLSDGYLDLDLLDQQAREILGYMRPDEIVIR